MIYYTNWTKKKREREKKTKRNEIFNVILVLGIYRNNIKGKLNEKNNQLERKRDLFIITLYKI